MLILRFATHSIAILVTPKFTPLTVEEEESFILRELTRRARDAKDDADQRKFCEKEYADRTDFSFLMCTATRSSRYNEPFEHHPAWTHESEVIKPMEQELEDVFLPLFFGLLYAIIGILLLKALLLRFFESVLPLLRSGFNGMRAKIADESILRTNKRLSAAVKQLDDLENLHVRGMITDDVFLDRKEEIKGALAKLNNEHQ